MFEIAILIDYQNALQDKLSKPPILVSFSSKCLDLVRGDRVGTMVIATYIITDHNRASRSLLLVLKSERFGRIYNVTAAWPVSLLLRI
jgi:hypothetical protein